MTGRALLALLLVTAACSDGPTGVRICAVGAVVPDSTLTIGCARDYESLGYEDDPFGTFAHTNTVNVLIEREAERVNFLNSARWWLHFDFVYFVLEGNPIVPPTDPAYTSAHVQFNQNYQSAERRYVMGKVIQYLDSAHLVFEMAAGDNADATMIATAFEQVRAQLYDGGDLVYRAVSNGQEALLPELQARGIPTISTEELFAGQIYQPLNRVTGYGTLRFRKSGQLAGQQLLPVDIVVLDRVPNDIAMVSGIVTDEFQTPLSHIGVLAKQRGIPNMGLRGAFTDPALRAFDGQLVKLTVTPTDWAIELADPAEAQAWWETRRPQTPLVPLYDLSVTGIVDLATVDEDAVISVGAKAANYAGLMGMIPVVPVPRPAYGLPFSAFDAHMTAHGLWAELDAILADAPVGEELEKRLFRLRWNLYTAPMDPLLSGAIHAHVVAQYGADEVRFRSSTNVEDLPQFSGAGLYTSAGADPALGPEAVERAVKVVWASAFNYAAFVERDFYRVDHRQVRMGVLLHRGFGEELANGVALTLNEFTALRPGFYINSQIGDVSVTNPTGEASPEQILWYRYYQGLPEYYQVLTRSSLTGGTPVLSDAQYSELAGYLERVHNHFRPIYCVIPGSDPQRLDPNCAIDVEWKLGTDGLLYLKQARPLGATP